MDEVKFADLNDVQVFFKDVGTVCKSASSTKEFYTDPINVKDFIGWCNKPLKNKSESGKEDQSCELGNTVLELNKLNEDELKEMESALKEGKWDKWFKDISIRASADDAVFYLVLKCRTDYQQHYHFYFDRDAVAEVNAFDPFTEDENGKQVLDQQWHVLISLLAYLDVAHALSNEQHEYHCLYPYLRSFDKDEKGDFKKRYLRLEWKKWGKAYRRMIYIVRVNRDKELVQRVGSTPYRFDRMMDWIEHALTGQLASENAQ